MTGSIEVRAQEIGQNWLAAFSAAVAAGAQKPFVDRVADDFCWRDVVALTWRLHTDQGGFASAGRLLDALREAGVTEIAADELPAHMASRGGAPVIEVLFTFPTLHGRCRGVARLVEQEGAWVAWTVLTALDELIGAEELVGDRRPTGVEFSRSFSGPNWLDKRREGSEYRGLDPAVLIVGCGQAGLALAARLKQLDVPALIIDRAEQVGDNWRKRYRSLTLHNEVWANHLPYLPFPENWPTYIPKDKLANWFESYAEAMELDIWLRTEFAGASYDSDSQHWDVVVRNGEEERHLRPRHIVMANGVSALPYVPEIAQLDGYTGEVLHSSQFESGEDFEGQSVIVIGTGTSAHDIAQELYCHDAKVALVQRGPTIITNVGPDAAGKVYALYLEGHSTDVADLLNVSIPHPLQVQGYQVMTAALAEAEKDLHASLERAGFRIWYGEDQTGFQMSYLRKGGGYYLNVGCSDLIAERQIAVVQFSRIDRFEGSELVLRNGSRRHADTVILATGFKSQQETVRLYFGDEIADRVGQVWGHDREGELRNMWVRTNQPGLWFTAGSLAQCRIYSKYLALQIKACELGLINPSLSSGAASQIDEHDNGPANNGAGAGPALAEVV